MLRRASLQVDISGINDAGLTPLHQAILDGNEGAVRLLVDHGADINKQDTDSWTPLHAACAEGHAGIVKFLLERGADKSILTEDGERPLDLVEPDDFATIRVMLGDIRHSDNDQSDDHVKETAVVKHDISIQELEILVLSFSITNIHSGFLTNNETDCSKHSIIWKYPTLPTNFCYL